MTRCKDNNVCPRIISTLTFVGTLQTAIPSSPTRGRGGGGAMPPLVGGCARMCPLNWEELITPWILLTWPGVLKMCPVRILRSTLLPLRPLGSILLVHLARIAGE